MTAAFPGQAARDVEARRRTRAADLPPTLRLLLAAGAMLCVPAPALGYVGPGAGFAFVSSLFVLIWTMALGLATLATLPIRWVVQRVRGAGRARAASRVRRVVVLGLDGQDPELTERLLDEGVLPHFARLRAAGAFCRLRTTLPAESPVAWSSFQTGCNPGKHRIFDFLAPNRRTHRPRAQLGARGPFAAGPAGGTVSPVPREAAHHKRAPQPAVLEDSGGPRRSPARSCGCRSPSLPSRSTARCCRR